MPDEVMREVVARAIEPTLWKLSDMGHPLDAFQQGAKSMSLQMAERALAAIESAGMVVVPREPTEAMVRDYDQFAEDVGADIPLLADQAWRVLLNASQGRA